MCSEQKRCYTAAHCPLLTAHCPRLFVKTMPDFNVRSDSVNVEQIMRQIRARIREKRGVDYTEQQIRELAAVKLERFLDPSKVRSELLQQFREGGIAPLPELRVRGQHAVRVASRAAAVDPPPAPADAEAAVQPQPADSRPALAGGHQHAPRAVHRAVVRDSPQPRAGGDAPGHRGQEPEDAGGVALGPARVRRAPRAGARGRGRVPPGRHRGRRASGGGAAGGPRGGAKAATSSGTSEARRRRRRRRGRRGGAGRARGR